MPHLERTWAGNLAEVNEQLLTERDELQRQTRELSLLKEQAERTARSMEWLARLSEEYPDPALRVYPDGRIRYMNPASFALCRRWNAGDRRRVPPAVQEIVAAVHASAEVVRREMTFGERAYLFTVAPAPFPASYVSIFASDITARKEAEKTLRELNAELEHRTHQLQKLTLELSEVEERERRRMADILHDDLQQILAAAKFNLSTLRSRVGLEPALQEMAVQVEQMLKDAIEKSRGLSHELSPPVLHHADLAETLAWLAGQMQAKHGLAVHVHAPGAVDLQSETITALLYRATQELLFNVVKHARVHEAGVRVRRHGPWVCLTVADRGRGFDRQELRAAAGCGLPSIRERIELLGGCMNVKTAPGRGSTFFLAVPDTKTPEDGGQKTEDGRKNEGQTLSSVLRPLSSVLRVLLADDHRIVRQSLRLLLRDKEGVEVVGEAIHGREAVDLALRLQPDVVIMDVSMPLIDGDVATRRIKEHLPRTRIIALSTYSEPGMKDRMYRAGAEGYVLKTTSAEELLAAIRGAELPL